MLPKYIRNHKPNPSDQKAFLVMFSLSIAIDDIAVLVWCIIRCGSYPCISCASAVL